MEILGYELEEEQLAMITPMPEIVEEAQEPPEPETTMTSEMRAWQRKALKRLKDGKSAAVAFVSSEIPAEKNAEILSSLADCKTAEEVKAVFSQVENESNRSPELVTIDIKNKPDPMMLIADELKRANDILERTGTA